MSTYYVAICPACAPDAPPPFDTEPERNRWILAHLKDTGHYATAATHNGPSPTTRKV